MHHDHTTYNTTAAITVLFIYSLKIAFVLEKHCARPAANISFYTDMKISIPPKRPGSFQRVIYHHKDRRDGGK